MLKDLLYPLIAILKFLYLGLYAITSNHGISLIGLSLSTALVQVLINRLLQKYVTREKQIQEILTAQAQTIKERYHGQQRHRKLQALYKRFAYNPILALRSSLPLFVQIPVLLSAFYMIGDLNIIKGQPLGWIIDLSLPDKMAQGLNVLPLTMTLINLISAFLTIDFNRRDKLQAILIAILFLALLYNSPSALLVYWTMNNLIFLVRTLYKNTKSFNRVAYKTSNASAGKSSTPFQFEVFLRHYFGILVLFYIIQAMAVHPWYMFCGVFKYIPFAAAAYFFWILQLKALLGRYKPNLQCNIALILIGFNVFFLIVLGLNIVAPIVQIQSEIYTLFHYIAFLLGISGLATGMLLHEPNHTTPETHKVYLLLIVFAVALIPALHFASVNPDYLRGVYYFVYALAILAITFVCYGILRLSCSINCSEIQISLSSAVFMFSIISLPLIRNMLKLRNDADFDFWIITAVLLFASFWIKSQRSFMVALKVAIITLGVFLISFMISVFSNRERDFSKLKKLTPEMEAIQFNNKPNIYLFIYDGIPNERVFRSQNLPFNKIRELVDRYGFKLYEDTYTLGEMSLDSMGNMLDIGFYFRSKVGKTTSEAHDTYAGNSYTNLILRRNGYKSHLLLNNYYVGINAITNRHLFEEIYPVRNKSVVSLDFFLILLRGIFQGEMNFDTKGWVESEINTLIAVQNRKQELIKDGRQSKFVVNHMFLPGHSQNSGVCLPDETEKWISNLSQALIHMENDFAAIEKNDPNAIVIAIGDHGPSLKGDCYRLAGWPMSKITPDLMWDRIGTMVAIRWPDSNKAAKYDSLLVTNQDIFPIVFAYLMDNPAPLALCPTDVFHGFKTPGRIAIGFDKGQLLP